ncbi:MAG TPA: hypothetical protein VFS96_03370 [Nitrolancea sp.]|nr:hypothetical protein [Nitrolancea sp.]
MPEASVSGTGAGGSSSDTWRLLRKLLLLAVPLLLLAAGIAAVDPFRYLRFVEALPAAEKKRIAGGRDPALWALARYTEAPSEAILLGDSRMANLPLSTIQEQSGTDYAMLAFGGANLREMVDAFWIADSTVRLQAVVMSVGFSQYAVPDPVDRVAVFRAWQANPLLYLINRTVLRSTMGLLQAEADEAGAAPGRPSGNRSEFWQSQLAYYGDRVMQGYSEHYGERDRLDAMASYCKAKDIDLTFVVMPTSAELHERIDDYDRQEEYLAFKKHLAALAPTIDLDTVDSLATRKSAFTDPVHVSPERHEHVIRAIWPRESRARTY